MRHAQATRDRGRGGYTLIEMSTVILVLLLAAAMIVPNFVAMRRSRDVQDLKADLLRVASKARTEARRSGVPCRLSATDSELVLERAPEGSEATTVDEVSFAGWLSIYELRAGANAADQASWQLTVYPDGTADTGAVIFREGSAIRSLVLSKDGHGRWVDGEPPDESGDVWSAGEIETRE